MKLEQLLVQYLYTNKKVSIQDIGTFTLSPDVVMPGENEKEAGLPENAIQFEFNGRQEKDDGLIDFIVEQSKKIRSLASSDLESYSLLSRQFLNIGKPMVIEGIGTLHKNQQGIYDFEQGSKANTKMVSNIHPVTIKENIQEEISFSTPPKSVVSSRGIKLLLAAIILACIGAAAYYFLNKNEEVGTEQPQVAAPVENNLQTPADTSLSSATDTINKASKAPVVSVTNDGSTFKIVLKDYPSKEAADKAFLRLTNYGHKLVVAAKDSASFKLYMPFTSPLSDTLRARDSIRKFFGGKPYVEL